MNQRIPTKNNMGWAISPEDEYVKEFIEYASQISPLSSMEIGAAYGFVSIKAAEQGANIIVNDLHEDHLTYMQEKLTDDLKKLVRFMPGNFLSLNIPQDSLGCILIARVLHMLNEKELKDAISLIKYWLKPGGKVFVTTATPYNKDLEKFLPTYEERKKSGLKNPGFISNLSDWLNEKNEQLPAQMQVFDLDTLISFFREEGFSTLKAGYIERPDQKNIVGNPRKDSCGLIAVKD